MTPVVWVIVLLIYNAPANAVDWPGPWATDHGLPVVGKTLFASEAECRNSAISWIGRIHQGMLAPIRFQCVPFPTSLPKGAPR
jgi:hypothetical protein